VCSNWSTGVLATREGSRVSGDKLLLNTLTTQLDVTNVVHIFCILTVCSFYVVMALKTKQLWHVILHLGKKEIVQVALLSLNL